MEIKLNATRSARARNAVALCVDENYFPFACFVADQIGRTANGVDLDIVICAPSGCEIPKGLADIRLCHLETGELFNGLFLDARRTENVYHCLVLPVAMQGEYDRILYLDADVFVHGGDFASLFNIDIGDFPIAAVRDNCQWVNPDHLVPVFKRLGLPSTKYLNSGVMLMDTCNYVDQDILAECVTYGRGIKDQQRQHDQELINCVLRGNWAELCPIWNWQQPIRSAYYEVMLPVAITHFIGPHKPWRDPEQLIPARFKIALSAFLTRYFPLHPKLVIQKSHEVPASYVRKLTIKNVIRDRPLRRYLKRFPEDLLADES